MKQFEVLIIGSGVMGRGIAKSFVSAGIPTAILSRNAANVTPGVDERVALIEKLPQDAPGLIIEAVPEKMALKLQCYAAIEAAYAGKPVLASNTSTLDLEELARPLQHPDRFLAIHYFMPADVNAVVEVAPVKATSTAATNAAVRWIEASGKSVMLLKRAVPGLLINRLQHAILHEAYHLMDEGVVTAEEIDRCAREILAPRICITGLIEQKDISGLDTHALAQQALVPLLHHGDKPGRKLQELYAAGRLGIKSGKGFYDWSGKDPAKVKAEAARKLEDLLAYLKEHR
ncbi:MAG: 3-hydroxyacyl-CoA dehydrogenase NAD-binding domain-containing protein [Deltaproteobacteria bacterium]|nr:3-hydroxyacyl-CoA dehydrogenase NAD-binding domain-containing protein [Deltaproteobacteria bacterium]